MTEYKNLSKFIKCLKYESAKPHKYWYSQKNQKKYKNC